MSAGSTDGDSLRFEQLFSQGAPTDIASASTVDIGAQRTNFLNVTGTTTITSLGTNYNGPKMLKFTGILTLTYDATTLVIPGAANVTTAANDFCIVVPKSTTSGTADGWQVIHYQRASGLSATAGANSDITSINGLTTAISGTNLGDKIQPITASVATNALTITLNPTTLDFRSSSLTSGTVNTRAITSAINLVISSGSTLGTTSGILSRIAVLAIDNAGTLELAAVNIAGGNDLSETGLISTTAEGGVGAADSASVIYSTTSRTNVPYRVVGFIESTQATAGTWASAPSLIQGKGGQAINAMSSLGYGQTWQAVTRISGTTYYNNTGKPILLQVTGAGVSGVGQVAINIQGVAMNVVVTSAGVSYTGLILIPDGAYYTLTDTNIASRTTFELR